MNTKNLMVSFVAIAMALFLVATVSAADFTIDHVTIDGVDIDDATITAGETITVKVYFSSDVDAKKVTVNLELDDVEAESDELIMKAGKAYREVLTLKVPYDFDSDKLETELDLDVTIKGEETDTGDDFKFEQSYAGITVLKPSYNVAFKSINVAKNVETGKTFQVDVVLKNTGYNDLEDLFVTARISALNLEERFWFGDLLHVETEDDDYDDDDTDTLSRRFYLTVPYGVVSGEYTLEVEVSNDDTVFLSEPKKIYITNSFPNTVIKSGNDLILVNPTDSMVGYRIVAGDSASVSESVVLVDAGSSKTVTVTPNVEGEYSFDVNVFSMDGKLVSTITFSGSEEVSPLASPIVVLTVILAIIFLVLLIVLIVLITKKPEKAEEFGESYY